MKGGFTSHAQKIGSQLARLRPLGRSGLTARYIEVSEPTKEPTPFGTKEAAEVAPAVAIEDEAVALDKLPCSKGRIVAKAKKRPAKRRAKRRAKVPAAPEEPYPF